MLKKYLQSNVCAEHVIFYVLNAHPYPEAIIVPLDGVKTLIFYILSLYLLGSQ